jgi:hypothetical protein
MYEYGKICLSHFNEDRKREHNGANEPNQDALYAYMEMSQ